MMGVRSHSSYPITDNEGRVHWINERPNGRAPRQSRVGWFGKMLVTLVVLVASVGGLAAVLPSTQSSTVTTPYVSRTLVVPTTAPPTTKASGVAALACTALGYR